MSGADVGWTHEWHQVQVDYLAWWKAEHSHLIFVKKRRKERKKVFPGSPPPPVGHVGSSSGLASLSSSSIMTLTLSANHQRTSGCWPEQESSKAPAPWIQIAFQSGSSATSSKIQRVHKGCQKFLPNNNFSLSKQSYANRPVKCLFTASWCVFSRLYWRRKHMGICSMCVQYVCETSLLQFTEKKDGGVSLKVVFFLCRQQTTVRMRPFTQCVLTSSRDACLVLNVSVCAKGFGNKVINRQKVEVTTSGANTGSCRREHHLLPLLTTPGTNRV